MCQLQVDVPHGACQPGWLPHCGAFLAGETLPKQKRRAGNLKSSLLCRGIFGRHRHRKAPKSDSSSIRSVSNPPITPLRLSQYRYKMSEKRPAPEDPSGGQLVVKRQNVGSSRALTRSGASGSSGALIQAVRNPDTNFAMWAWRSNVVIGTANKCAAGAGNGAVWTLGRDLYGQV